MNSSKNRRTYNLKETLALKKIEKFRFRCQRNMDMANVKPLASTGSSDWKIYQNILSDPQCLTCTMLDMVWHAKYMGTKVSVAKSIVFDGRRPMGPWFGCPQCPFVELCDTCQGSDCRSASSSASGAPCLSIELNKHGVLIRRNSQTKNKG